MPVTTDVGGKYGGFVIVSNFERGYPIEIIECTQKCFGEE